MTRTALAALLSFMLPSAAMALPMGGTVIPGTATITQGTPTNFNVQQTSQHAVIDWSSFNTSGQERVQFNNPPITAITQNKVSDQGTTIDGTLQSNQTIIIKSPNIPPPSAHSANITVQPASVINNANAQLQQLGLYGGQ